MIGMLSLLTFSVCENLRIRIGYDIFIMSHYVILAHYITLGCCLTTTIILSEISIMRSVITALNPVL